MANLESPHSLPTVSALYLDTISFDLSAVLNFFHAFSSHSPPDFRRRFISFHPPLFLPPPFNRLNYPRPSDLRLNETVRSPLSSTVYLLCANIITFVIMPLFVSSLLECKLYGGRSFGCLIYCSIFSTWYVLQWALNQYLLNK